MDGKYYGLESSLSAEDSSLLPVSNISSLCNTYLNDLDTGAGKSIGIDGRSSSINIKSSIPNINQWGPQECMIWAKALCHSTGLNENTLPTPISTSLSDMTGHKLVQMTSRDLAHIFGHDNTKLFHSNIQALKKHKTGKGRSGKNVEDVTTIYNPSYNTSSNSLYSQYSNQDSEYSNQDSLYSNHDSLYSNQHSENSNQDPLSSYSTPQPHEPFNYPSYNPQLYQCKQENDYNSPSPVSPSTFHDSPYSSSYPSPSSHPSIPPSFPDPSWDLDSADFMDLDRYLPQDEFEAGFEPLANDMKELDLQKDLLAGATQACVEESMNSADVISHQTTALKKIPTKTRRRERGPKSWEFLMRLLASAATNPSLVRWEDETAGTFRLTQPTLVAQMWGGRSDKYDLSYVNFARGLRYHYTSGALQPVSERQLVYRCGPQALQYLKELSDKGYQ